MKISTLNTQNNNNSNKQANPAFGMLFSEVALEGIENSKRFITKEMADSLAKLRENNDTCVLTKFLIKDIDYDGSGAFREVTISVEDRHGIPVYHHDSSASYFKERILKKFTQKIRYLATEKFKEKVAKLDKKHAAIAADKQEKQRLLGEIASPVPAALEKVLPAFVKALDGDEKKARLLLQELAQRGITDEQTLRETATEM